MHGYKIVLNLVIFGCIVISIYVLQTENFNIAASKFINFNVFNNRSLNHHYDLYKDVPSALNKSFTKRNDINTNFTGHNNISFNELTSDYNVWCIFTKAKHKNSPLRYKFERFIKSILRHSSIVISLNVISDSNSRIIAESVINKLLLGYDKPTVESTYYDVAVITRAISNLTAIMQPVFSPQRGGYYSDALFYISLELYRLSKPTQTKAIMVDIDTEFRADIRLLFEQFNSFSENELLGLAPELSPVYQHVLFVYRARNKNSNYGSPFSGGGFPGLNSGVILFRFDRLRGSQLYKSLMTKDAVDNLISKYSFMGHLGDQDMYTLIKMEHPELIHILPCNWNRQLCKWWRDHGYPVVFDSFAKCDGPVHLYHGNCNTPIPFHINPGQNKSD